MFEKITEAVNAIIPNCTDKTISLNGRKVPDIFIIEINSAYINVTELTISLNNVFRNYPSFTLVEIDIVPGKGGLICNIYIRERKDIISKLINENKYK